MRWLWVVLALWQDAGGQEEAARQVSLAGGWVLGLSAGYFQQLTSTVMFAASA